METLIYVMLTAAGLFLTTFLFIYFGALRGEIRYRVSKIKKARRKMLKMKNESRIALRV